MSETSTDAHLAYLERAVRLAGDNVAAGGGPFAALVVAEGTLVSLGVNQVTSTHDPTAHAEIVAIRRACAELATFSLRGAVLYCSCEPCPMCLAASMWARVAAVYYAADRHDAERAGFDDSALYALLSSPRESWPQPVRSLRTPHASAPFDAWLAHGARVDY
ncbi:MULTISPECIES: nucleoside deaminase [Mumia]|uniref:nucleoside deaminase n=1 Tax=Mumia TaxID=1546255 RepID=UPI00141E08E7|nr:nucleoside deaminase [Mumia sp. ZJ430]